MLAASVGLTMAIISISKLLLVICGLATFLFAQRVPEPGKHLAGISTPEPVTILASIFAFSLSLLWTVAPQADALGSVAKYGKPYARATQSALLALAVACLFNSSIDDALIGNFFCVLMGLLLALGLSKTTNETGVAPQPERLS